MASALFRMSISGGGYVTGGQVVALGATVQLKADSTVGWGSPPARYEIYGYPPGFACPAGWSVDVGDPAQVYYYVGNTDEPPSFTVNVWGVYMLALHVNGGGGVLSYLDNALKILGPGGMHDVGRFERGQFSAVLGWLYALQQNFRALDAFVAGAVTLTASAPANVTKAAAAVGVSSEAARADHKHDVATAAAVALTVGGANAEGSSSSLARADHTHALAAGTPVAVTVGGSNTEGAASTAARSDHTHALAAGTPVALTVGGSNTEGVAATAARSDHVHAIAAGTPVSVGSSNSEGAAATFARSDHVHAALQPQWEVITSAVANVVTLNKSGGTLKEVVLPGSGTVSWSIAIGTGWTAGDELVVLVQGNGGGDQITGFGAGFRGPTDTQPTVFQFATAGTGDAKMWVFKARSSSEMYLASVMTFEAV
jgi:hypothetical protein